jgi:ribosome-associated translation inhibitor RaiA
MDTPLEIIFRNMRPSFRIRDRIEDYVDKLDRFDDRIQRCRVILRSPRRGQQKAGAPHVTIHAALSNQEIVIGNHASQHRAHYGPAVAVQKAFETLMHRLEEIAQARQGKPESRQGASPKDGDRRRRRIAREPRKTADPQLT